MLSLYIMIKTCKIIDFDLSQDIKVANLHSIEELSNSFLYEDLYCVVKLCVFYYQLHKKDFNMQWNIFINSIWVRYNKKLLRATHCLTQRKPK